MKTTPVPIPIIGEGTSRILIRNFGHARTAFFRKGVFDSTYTLIRDTLKSSTAVKKILVVGCSTGEEPYSLAMALSNDSLVDRANLLAIDKDKELIIFAAKGIYELSSYKALLPDFSHKFFKKNTFPAIKELKFYQVDKCIKREIKFQVADITATNLPEHIKNYDTVVLNNVWMHLSEKERTAAFRNLAKLLKAGGCIITNEDITNRSSSFVLNRWEGPSRMYTATV